MSFPISIGDVVLLGQIAWKLAQAFTNGQNSAPSEFREVENQLYALSSALKALSDAQNHNSALTANGSSVASLAGQDEENARWDMIRIILNNCHNTLKHLESFAEKYGIVVDASDLSAPRFKRWREDLFRNWKKVTWTKEAGTLATLRSQVVIHTNSLNLILGVINNSQTARIESDVRETSKILKEIHAWYTDDLKDVEVISRPQKTPQGTDSPQRRSFTDSPIHTFELTVEIDDGQKPLCGCASLKPDRDEELDDARTGSQRALFVCCCPNETASHRATIEAYGLSHRSFQVRLAGKEMTWLLYHIADRQSNRLVEMRIRGVTAAAAEEFHAKLEDMREELFVLNLNYPRPDETVVHLQSAQVGCEDIFIVDASITIVHDSRGKYRLIIVSRNKCTVLSQVLADDFFSPSTGRPSFASPTWLVQIEGNGIRHIYYRQNGLRFLDFRNTQSKRMFELGCSTVSMNQRVGGLTIDGMDTGPGKAQSAAAGT
ncbi:hypothetical protein DL768_000172 [Monosporascus sp. mg162]|nr:hypothetical protein DL768_000172 [Monosporascus sp. mg162]